ncbi:MAG: CYTH domain-containing protein [Thermoplasmatales archaeon]
MGFKNREIELKLQLVTDQSYNKLLESLEQHLEVYYPEYETIHSKAADYYWDVPKSAEADFIRLRKKDSGKGGTITIKSTDKGSNVDRAEIDVDIEDFKQGLALMTALYGSPKEKVNKKYHVLFLENDHTNYSIYQIEKDRRIFLEIEARSGKRVAELVESFIKAKPEFQFVSIQSSIYEMFVKKKDPKVNDLTKGLEIVRAL